MEPALDEVGIEITRDEIRFIKDFLVERDRGMDTFNDEQVERAFHAGNRFGSIRSVSDQFGDQRIVIRRNNTVLMSVRIDANPDAPGRLRSR